MDILQGKWIYYLIHHERVYSQHGKHLAEPAHHDMYMGSLWIQSLLIMGARDNDNDNILFNHNIQIEIIMYNSLENQIIILVWRLLLRQINLSLS